jgi:hypothetical protein
MESANRGKSQQARIGDGKSIAMDDRESISTAARDFLGNWSAGGGVSVADDNAKMAAGLELNAG